MIRKIQLSEANGEMDYQKFLNYCQNNPTYKKAKAICDRYDRQLAELCYITDYDTIEFRLEDERFNQHNYKPTIYYGSRYCESPSFRIQTTSYGALDLSEYQMFIQNVTDAYNLVAELSELDLSTLASQKEFNNTH